MPAALRHPARGVGACRPPVRIFPAPGHPAGLQTVHPPGCLACWRDDNIPCAGARAPGAGLDCSRPQADAPWPPPRCATLDRLQILHLAASPTTRHALAPIDLGPAPACGPGPL